MQFSTDGSLLISHSEKASLKPAFINVFNSSSGDILSSRGYSTGSYGKEIKSMIVSSGASPMAYVLSN